MVYFFRVKRNVNRLCSGQENSRLIIGVGLVFHSVVFKPLMSAKNHANESTSFNDDNIAFHTQINECNILCPNNNAVRG